MKEQLGNITKQHQELCVASGRREDGMSGMRFVLASDRLLISKCSPQLNTWTEYEPQSTTESIYIW